MTHLHFTLKTSEIQNLIHQSVKDQLMENQRTQHIRANEYERSDNRKGQRNGYYERKWTTSIRTVEITVTRTCNGQFSPTLFEWDQRNEKALLASMLEMYVSGVSTRKVSNVVEKLCGTSISKSFVSQLTVELDPVVREWRNRSLSETKFPYIVTD